MFSMFSMLSMLQGCSQCCALHGLSLLVTATFEGKRRTVLFDAGIHQAKCGALEVVII